MQKLSLYILLTILTLACVSQKKYNELANQKDNLEQDKAALTEELAIAAQKISRLEKKVNQIIQDSLQLHQSYQAVSTELAQLKTKHQQLQKYYDDLLTNSGQLNKDLATQQKRLMDIEADLEITRRKNDELSQNLAEREQKVRELENILAEKEAAVNQLRKIVSDALLNFKENELSVEVRNGKVYVSLAEQLLFKSGSIQVDPKGIQALNTLAQAIKDNQDLHILVEGHTDDVPISRVSNYMKNNWDLSVMRATSIVKILTEAGVDPGQITAAGRGEYQPIASNDQNEGRQKNRRTEIILTPKLDELFQILQAN
ncbi:MAG: OmpA family protein [Candidatus Cyclobacteriaceae bacterium M3_2C_046]